MAASERHDPTTAELLARMDTMQQQYRAEIQALTATVHHQQSEISALKGGTAGTNTVHAPPASLQTRVPSIPWTLVGGRGKRLGVGVSLALLLIVAPGGSAVTHAAYEGLVNTAYGSGALYGNTGTFSSAFGVNALHSSPSGDQNTASGSDALYSNTTGTGNTASGAHALYSNTTGNYNTASGTAALYFNTTGTGNTASGFDALYSNTTGDYNTASGVSALASNTTGDYNTASGRGALWSNTTGTGNTAVGEYAGYTTTPANANTTGSNNTFIGYNSGSGVPDQLTNATAIGANALVSQSNSIVLGGTGANTQRVGVGTTTPHSALQVAKGFLQIRPIAGSAPAPAQCATTDDAGRLVVRTDGTINLYVCNGTTWIGK